MILLISQCTIEEISVGHVTHNFLSVGVLEQAGLCCGNKYNLLKQAVFHVCHVIRSCEMDI